MTVHESGERVDGDSRPQELSPEAARRLAADEISRLASLSDEALHDEMDRNWLAPSDPEVYAIWLRLYELGLGDAFQKFTGATPDDVEEVNLRFELEAAGVIDEEEVDRQVDEFRQRRTPFSDRLLAGEFSQPHAGEIPELLELLVNLGLPEVAQALPLEILKSIVWHENYSNSSRQIPRSPDETRAPLGPAAWRETAAEYCRRMRAELSALSDDRSGRVAADLIRRVQARTNSQ